jgi:hypothetical protein
MWINPYTVNSGGLISKRDPAEVAGNYTIRFNNSRLNWKLWSGPNASGEVLSSPIITPNVWTYIVLTFDDITNTAKFYINGELDTDGSMSNDLHNTDDILKIGHDGQGQPYNGEIDEVLITKDVLTQEEVSNLYAGSYFGELDNIISYYNFNGGSGSTVTDLSGNGNDGTINGASWITQGTPDVITYTPNANYNGPDSFTFTVSDGQATSSLQH